MNARTAWTAKHAAPSRLAPLGDRWGLPPLRGRTWLLVAALLDSVGSGLVYAFTMIFFLTRTDLSVVEVGLALTLAMLIALPVPAAVGPLIDRFGARAVTVGANLVSALGFAGYLWADRLWQVVLVGFTVQLGVAAYWTAYSPLVAATVPPGDRTRWFGAIHAGRNIGVGLGGAVAGVALAASGSGSGILGWLVLGNVGSYLAAAWLVARRAPAPVRERATISAGADLEGTTRGGYRDVLGDRVFLLLLAVNVAFVLGGLVLNVLLAVYIVDVLEAGAWIAGALLTLNTVLIAGFQPVVARWSQPRRKPSVVAWAALLNAVAFAVFAVVAATPAWLVVPGLVAALCVYTLAELLQSPAMSTLSVELPPQSLRGRYQAVYQTSWTLGGALGPVVLTALLARGPALPWVLLGGLSLLSIPLARAMDRRMPVLSPASAPAVVTAT